MKEWQERVASGVSVRVWESEAGRSGGWVCRTREEKQKSIVIDGTLKAPNTGNCEWMERKESGGGGAEASGGGGGVGEVGGEEGEGEIAQGADVR